MLWIVREWTKVLLLTDELAVIDMKHIRAAAQAREQRQIGARHPGLRAQRHDLLEQGGAAGDVQMRRDLVQQQERRMAVARRGKLPGIGEDDGDQQCLLLAGRTFARIRAFRGMAHRQIGQMRPRRRPPGLRVAHPRPRQLLAQGLARAIAKLG